MRRDLGRWRRERWLNYLIRSGVAHIKDEEGRRFSKSEGCVEIAKREENDMICPPHMGFRTGPTPNRMLYSMI